MFAKIVCAAGNATGTVKEVMKNDGFDSGPGNLRLPGPSTYF
ncbi:hypothetical protein [Pseudomonas sp. MWU16-30317]|nr:hypothetical protein [Pseudomonas sp. MWU16-30317]